MGTVEKSWSKDQKRIYRLVKAVIMGMPPATFLPPRVEMTAAQYRTLAHNCAFVAAKEILPSAQATVTVLGRKTSPTKRLVLAKVTVPAAVRRAARRGT